MEGCAVLYFDYHPKYQQWSQIACARVLDVGVTLLGDDEFGEVSGGRLRIVCTWLIPCRVTMINELPALGLRLGDCFYYPFRSHRQNPNHGGLSADLDCTDDTDTLIGGEAYLLPMTATSTMSVEESQQREGKEPSHEDLRGLILRRNDSTVGEFQRIGFFICRTRPLGDQSAYIRQGLASSWNQVVQTLLEQGTETAKIVCAETIDNQERPEEKYVIDIV